VLWWLLQPPVGYCAAQPTRLPRVTMELWGREHVYHEAPDRVDGRIIAFFNTN
jgi:hypothetical protein